MIPFAQPEYVTCPTGLVLPKAMPVSSDTRDSYSRGYPGCARTAARTSSLCEWCSDRAGHTLIFGAGDHAGIPKGPVAPRGRAAPDNLAVPTDSDTHRDSERPNH